MKVDIFRFLFRNDGTFGVLVIDNFPVCVTLELPWEGNQPRISCIPAGKYQCKRVDSPKFGDTFEICNVPGRTAILFHGANTMNDLLGCVGLAEFFHRFEGKAGVANPSKGAAFIEFHQLTKNVNEFELTIWEPFKQ